MYCNNNDRRRVEIKMLDEYLQADVFRALMSLPIIATTRIHAPAPQKAVRDRQVIYEL